MVQYTLEQCVFLYDTYMKYGFAGKCQRKFRRKFRDERVPSRQTIHNLVNKLRTTGLLIDKKIKHKHRVLTEKLDDTGASSNPRTKEELKENIRREISNTAAEKSSEGKSKPLLPVQGVSMCRGTAFSTPPVICEQR
jgi:hypothetical protein